MRVWVVSPCSKRKRRRTRPRRGTVGELAFGIRKWQRPPPAHLCMHWWGWWGWPRRSCVGATPPITPRRPSHKPSSRRFAEPPRPEPAEPPESKPQPCTSAADCVDGCTLWLEDADGDGFGNPNTTRGLCGSRAPASKAPLVRSGKDCCDLNERVRRNLTEAFAERFQACDASSNPASRSHTPCVERGAWSWRRECPRALVRSVAHARRGGCAVRQPCARVEDALARWLGMPGHAEPRSAVQLGELRPAPAEARGRDPAGPRVGIHAHRVGAATA
jgi:hypothetical protein